MKTELEDINHIRNHFSLDEVILIGHSWGGLLALEYSLKYPSFVSHIILMNTAPVSHHDFLKFRENLLKISPDEQRLIDIGASDAYQEGDLFAVLEFHRLYFSSTVKNEDLLEELLMRLTKDFSKNDLFKAREIADRLVSDTWMSTEYNLLPPLEKLKIPTLIICSKDDFIPIECSRNIAKRIPNSRLKTLSKIGHFSYLEDPDAIWSLIEKFFSNISK